jgi:hypothetical protein
MRFSSNEGIPEGQALHLALHAAVRHFRDGQRRANSCRSLCIYFKGHREKLNEAFGIHWKRPPAHTSIRNIPRQLDPKEVKRVFREHAANLNGAPEGAKPRIVTFDGKMVKGILASK